MKAIQWMLLVLFFHVAVHFAVAAADPAPAPAPWILPPGPTPPAPPPTPPNTPIPLLPGYPYIIRANVVGTVVASPDGLVKVCQKAEPITICDASGSCTDYTGDKSVYVVSAVKAGACELILVSPDGAVIRVQLAVGGVVPPTPPVPPTPTDPLAAVLQAAYTADTDAAKAVNLPKLASLYRQAVAVANDPTQKTYADVLGTLEQAALILLPKGALPKVQVALSTEIQATLGTSLTAPVDRPAASKEFQRIADILGGLKP